MALTLINQKSAIDFQPSYSQNTGGVEKLYVKKQSGILIKRAWNPPENMQLNADEIYLVKCSQTGYIDWKRLQKTDVYAPIQLVTRNNVIVVT